MSRIGWALNSLIDFCSDRTFEKIAMLRLDKKLRNPCILSSRHSSREKTVRRNQRAGPKFDEILFKRFFFFFSNNPPHVARTPTASGRETLWNHTEKVEKERSVTSVWKKGKRGKLTKWHKDTLSMWRCGKDARASTGGREVGKDNILPKAHKVRERELYVSSSRFDPTDAGANAWYKIWKSMIRRDHGETRHNDSQAQPI